MEGLGAGGGQQKREGWRKNGKGGEEWGAWGSLIFAAVSVLQRVWGEGERGTVVVCRSRDQPAIHIRPGGAQDTV